MQHQYWITKQTLSRKLGRKDDECIVSSDAELDSKLELFRNIQVSCNVIQRIIDRYQEANCTLSQELSVFGRFLKEASEAEKTNAAEVMLAVGKSLTFCAQQQLILHEPLLRFHQEVETFRQRAIADTLQNVTAMEKSRTEYRAALSWMKDISQQLDPDTTKQLAKFKKVQNQVRLGKKNFDKLALDCSQKVDLLAAARCNMLNYALTFYQKRLAEHAKKSAQAYLKVVNILKQPYPHESLNEDTDKSPKESDNKRSSFSDNKDLPKNNSFEKLIDYSANENLNKNDLASTCITDNIIDYKESDMISSFDWDTATPSTISTNDELQKLFTNCINNLNQIDLNDKDKTNDFFKTDDLFSQGQNAYLPSNILNQTMENSCYNKKEIDKKIFNLTKNNEIPKSTSWLNLFKDLDPLENNGAYNTNKNENSLV